MFPCIAALRQYGLDAVAPIADAALQEPNKFRRDTLLLGLGSNEAERLAVFYTRGILTSGQTCIKVNPKAASDLRQRLSQRSGVIADFPPDI